MTITMIAPCLPENSPAWNIARISPNSMEYEIAGFLLWTTSLDHRLIDFMEKFGWFRVPLDKWKDSIKPHLDTIRRTGMFGNIKDDCVYQLRKVINVTYRRDAEADWEKELLGRTRTSRGKVLLSGKRYYAEFYRKAQEFESDVVQRIAARRDCSGLAEWYGRRHHHVPKGSTSSGSWIRRIMREDERLDKNDRPNKKSVFEALDISAFEYALKTPPLLVARASTKPEPADKRRALYATNDVSYLVSSFASVHAEKEMAKWGAVARQSIDDFANWIKQCAETSGYWQSVDYSSYNEEHELLELYILNMARCKAWLTVTHPASHEKAQAARWLAEACMCSFVQFPKTETIRVFSGLYSGSRDTARDNTAKHSIDLQLALQDCRDIGFDVAPFCNYQSGDDEDTRHRHPLEAAIYVKVLAAQNHNLNPVKQLAGARHHEFLQVMADEVGAAQRPLAALLATLASGNWYVPTATWFQSAISGLSDNWWEAAVRGLDLQVCRRMATAYLDTIMRVRKEDGSYHNLEWWDYRSPRRPHPLWGVVTDPPPEITEKPPPAESWPSLSTDDWMAQMEPFLRTVPKRKQLEYRKHLLEESHGSVFLRWRQHELFRQALERWPSRKARTYDYGCDSTPAGFNIREMARFFTLVPSSQRPRDEAELASRLGVDPQLIALAGGWANLQAYVPVEKWAQFAEILPQRDLTPRCAASSWAFRSWASRTAVEIPLLHANRHVTKRQRMLYIFANNGAGKGWLRKTHASWVELDKYAAKFAAMRPKWRADGKNRTARLTFLSQILHAALADGVEVLLGQWHIEDVIAVGEKIGIAFTALYYEPGEAVRIERIRKRGQSDEEILHLAQRWRTYPNPYKEPGALIEAAQAIVASF